MRDLSIWTEVEVDGESVDVCVNISMDDILYELSKSQIEYMIKSFREDGYLPKESKTSSSEGSLEYSQAVAKLFDGYMMLSKEEVDTIIKISEKLL